MSPPSLFFLFTLIFPFVFVLGTYGSIIVSVWLGFVCVCVCVLCGVQRATTSTSRHLVAGWTTRPGFWAPPSASPPPPASPSGTACTGPTSTPSTSTSATAARWEQKSGAWRARRDLSGTTTTSPCQLVPCRCGTVVFDTLCVCVCMCEGEGGHVYHSCIRHLNDFPCLDSTHLKYACVVFGSGWLFLCVSVLYLFVWITVRIWISLNITQTKVLIKHMCL